MRHSWIVLSTISLTLLLGSAPALADSCSAIRSQMRASASASNSQSAQLRRQVAAIRAVERQRGCTAEKAASGGFFNACRGLAQQRAQVERQAAQAGGGPSTAALQARYRSLGCDAQQRRQPSRTQQASQQERLVKAPKSKRSGAKYAGDTLYYCVRPSDGYLFPAPQSQFAKGDYAKDALDQCRFICEDETMALYLLEDPELETEEMISVETKRPYGQLPTAFRYQKDEAFEACNWPRYFARVNELRARTVTPRNMANAVIPLPTSRPRLEAVSTAPAEVEDTPAASGERRVRVIGPTYLPPEETEIEAGYQAHREHEEAARQDEGPPRKIR